MTESDSARAGSSVTGTDKALVLLLGFAWGFNWTAAKLALEDIPPWSLRFAGVGWGALTLFVAAYLTRSSLVIPRGQRLHIMIAGIFNVAAFNIFSALAQMGTATSRVVIIAYSMPIWAALLARFALGEKLNAVRLIALVLCAVGLTILLRPLFAGGWPTGVYYSLGCALAWAVGTIYVKWSKLQAAPIAVAAWQLLFGWLLVTIGMVIVEGGPHLWPMRPSAMAGVAYNGLIGLGLAYFLWFAIIDRLPTTTASLGSLIVPVIGVIASAAVLGERPTMTDIVGFVLIFSAAACVLLQPHAPPPPEKEWPE